MQDSPDRFRVWHAQHAGKIAAGAGGSARNADKVIEIMMLYSLSHDEGCRRIGRNGQRI
jgi:hypothetical protein